MSNPAAHAEWYLYTTPAITQLSWDEETQTHTPFRATTTHIHRTWAKTFQCRPELYLQPESLKELQLIVKLASLNRKKLITVGSGHSPSDLTCTRGWMLNLDNFAKPLAVDLEKLQMTVQAGMRLHTLLEELDARGWAMPTLGSITEQSIAGAIATSTHGSSLQHGLLSESVVEIKLLTASGEVITCSQEENEELFKAALVSLGALGVVVEVTVQAVPAYDVAWEQRVVKLDYMLDRWEKGLWTEHEFIRCWWFPYTERAIVWHGDKTEKPRQKRPSSWYGGVVGRFVYETLLEVARWCPRIMPYVERFVFWMQYGGEGVIGRAVERSTEALTMDCLFPQLVNEWSIPLSKGPEAISRIQNWLTAHDPATARIPISPSGVFVHAPIEVRVSNTNIRSQNPYLDQSCKSEPTLYLNATLYRPFLNDIPKWRTYFEAFEYVMKELGGKPHWAKNHVTVGKKEIWGMYPEIQKWVDVRDKLDLERVFVNGWLEREVLGGSMEETKADGVIEKLVHDPARE